MLGGRRTQHRRLRGTDGSWGGYGPGEVLAHVFLTLKVSNGIVSETPKKLRLVMRVPYCCELLALRLAGTSKTFTNMVS